MQGNHPLNTKGCTFLAVLYIPTFLPPNWLYPKTCSLVATWWLQPFKYLHEDTTSSKNVSFGVHFPVPCCAQLLSCVQLFATPWTVAHQVPLSIGESPGKNTGVGCYAFLQGIFPLRGSNPGLLHCRQSLYHLSHHFPAAAAAKSLQSCPTLCDPIDSSPPGSPFPGIFQARVLECVAIAFSSHFPRSEEIFLEAL